MCHVTAARASSRLDRDGGDGRKLANEKRALVEARLRRSFGLQFRIIDDVDRSSLTLWAKLPGKESAPVEPSMVRDEFETMPLEQVIAVAKGIGRRR